jgi:hypothetical protein
MCVFRQQHKERMNRTSSTWLTQLCQLYAAFTAAILLLCAPRQSM